MSAFLHDIDLGPKPDAREIHRLIAENRNSPLLLMVMHYLRDEAADSIGRSIDATRNSDPETAHLELGGHELLVQVFTKFNRMRNEPLPVEFAPEG